MKPGHRIAMGDVRLMRITELLVDEGDAVAEDQVVARLDAD